MIEAATTAEDVNEIDRSIFPIVVYELLVLVFTVATAYGAGQIWPLDTFMSVLVGYMFFCIGTLIVLNIMQRISPLAAGRYNITEHPQIIRTWQIFNFLAMNNLFIHYQNGLIPPMARKFISQLLGAKIGSGLISVAGPIFDPYMISLGENTMVGQDAILKPSIYNGNELVLGPIRVGDGSIIGARSVVMPNVTIGKNALVKAMSVVAEGTQINDNEIWGGIPARKMGISSEVDVPQRFDEMPYIVLCVMTQVVILGFSGVITWSLAYCWGADFFISVIVFYFLQCGISMLMLTAIRLLFPFKEGVFSYRSDRWMCYRWNLFAFIGITNLFLHYQRDLTPPFLRRFFAWLMGARLPLRTNFIASGGVVFDPFFIEIDPGAVIGYEALLLPHAIAGDKLHLKKVKVGQGAMIGDRSLVMLGAHIGRGAVIEPLSLVTSNTQVPDGEIWGGVPARKKGNVASETSVPVRVIDFFGVICAETVILAGSIGVLLYLQGLYRLSAFESMLVFYCAWIVMTLLVLKIIRMLYTMPEGEFLQSKHPVLFLFWKLHAFLCVTNLFVHYQNALLPPCMRKQFLALIGTKVSFRGFNSIAAALVADPYLVTLGKNSLLGHESLILALSMRGERLTLRRVKIGQSAVIGERAVILPGVDIGDYAQIMPLSLVEENTHVPAYEIWGGIPARKIGERKQKDSTLPA